MNKKYNLNISVEISKYLINTPQQEEPQQEEQQEEEQQEEQQEEEQQEE